MADSGEMSRPAKGALIGLVGLGVIGAIVGLIRGLTVYPPTAWFAVIEAGLPSALLGAIVGGVAGLVAQAAERRKGRRDKVNHRPV